MANQPRIESTMENVPGFSHEFVTRMRRSEEVRFYPSVRQTQAIPKFLSARYFKQGGLSLDDFVDAAVFTTHPPDQKIARKIAEDILLGRERQKMPPPPVKEVKKPASGNNTHIQSIIDQIIAEQELAAKIQQDKVEAGYAYLQELRKKMDKQLHSAAMDYLNEGDVVLQGISSDSELKEKASDELIQGTGNLSHKDLLNAATLNSLERICDSSFEAEQIAARALRGDSDVAERFSALADRDPSSAAQSLKLMEDLERLSDDMLKAMDKELQKSLKNLDEAAEYASRLERTPGSLDQHVKSAYRNYSLSDAMEMGSSIESATGERVSDNVMKSYADFYEQGARDKVDFRQLAENHRSTSSWNDLVDRVTDDILTDADTRSAPSDFLKQKIKEMMNLKKGISDAQCRNKWQESMQELADGVMGRSPDRTHLRQSVQQCSSMGAPASEQAVTKAGRRVGMSDTEIQELLNPSFEVIKKLIQAGVSDFDRLHTLVSQAGLSHQQLRILADMAHERDNQSALGAIGHHDLRAAMGQSGRGMHGVDQKRANSVFGGLMGGPASNVIRIWYSYRDELPPELRQRLKKIASQLLIDLGLRYSRQTMGSSMLGGIQESTTVRPFRIGDDIDLIDLEETIDHLLSSGNTNFNFVDPEDFLITETYQGHRAFYWALDKSGSMHSPEKLGMLSISVMAGLYGVQKDDFGVVLFDSHTHVVKEIADKSVSVEKVAADLLEVRASGGTGGRQSMNLALRNFEDTRAKEKIFIFSTDAYLSDQSICEELATKFKQQGIEMIILVPRSSYNSQAAEKLAEKSHGAVLDIASIEELPERLLKLTNY
ncbi:VWA domain-containing protein [Candidatus Thorarchaeota archaeon]|nr:MAG: VWA domain-containing protein [Candidatus Thorarchaeota archaeon]